MNTSNIQSTYINAQTSKQKQKFIKLIHTYKFSVHTQRLLIFTYQSFFAQCVKIGAHYWYEYVICGVAFITVFVSALFMFQCTLKKGKTGARQIFMRRVKCERKCISAYNAYVR